MRIGLIAGHAIRQPQRHKHLVHNIAFSRSGGRAHSLQVSSWKVIEIGHGVRGQEDQFTQSAVGNLGRIERDGVYLVDRLKD